MDKNVAISVKNVSFSYRRFGKENNILDHVYLTVPSGVIYGLLGPSGCGKTTLLNAITGRLILKPNQGEIVVFGQKQSTEKFSIPGPGVGYMPQDLALHEYLTVKESLNLFARLNGVLKEDVASRMKNICNLLQLPKPNSLIKNLSGGQQRRVSLAHALIHEAPLLILDEPTVGVDPMLRNRIWSHLVTLATSRNITILITTHYIEEAKEAHMIAGMRKGKILMEEKPSTLMRALNCNNLELCFTALCCLSEKDELETFKAIKLIKNNEPSSSNFTSEIHYRKAIRPHPSLFTKTKLMCQRNIILLKRSHMLLLFQLLVPLANIGAICVCMGNALTGISLAVINDEGSNGYAQQFLNNIDLDMVSMKTHDFENGIRDVENGKSVAAIHLRANFTECFSRKLKQGLDADNETIRCGSVWTYFDLTKSQIYYSLSDSLLLSFKKFMKSVLKTMGKSTAIAELPVDFSKLVDGSYDTSYGDNLIPGMSVFLLFYLATGVTVLKIIQEINNGLEDRFWVNGITKINMILSHTIISFIIGVCQVVTSFVFIFCIYHLPLKGSVIIVAVIGMLQCISGLSFGFLLSSMFRRESEAFFVVNGIMVCHLFVTGILWPLEAVPHHLRNFCYFLPIVMPAEAVKGIVHKGWGLEQSTVQLGLLSSLVWIFVLCGCVVLKVKRSI